LYLNREENMLAKALLVLIGAVIFTVHHAREEETAREDGVAYRLGSDGRYAEIRHDRRWWGETLLVFMAAAMCFGVLTAVLSIPQYVFEP
jgi:hypothetical protein